MIYPIILNVLMIVIVIVFWKRLDELKDRINGKQDKPIEITEIKFQDDLKSKPLDTFYIDKIIKQIERDYKEGTK